MPEQKYVLLCRSKAAAVTAAAESQCLFGPLAFWEFPAENTQAWEAGMGADKHQTTSTSCISSMHGSFYIWTHDIPKAGGKGCGVAWGHVGHSGILPLLEEGSDVKVINRFSCTEAVSKLSSYLNLLVRVKCSFTGWKGARGVDSGLLCVSKVVSTLGATSHLSASP